MEDFTNFSNPEASEQQDEVLVLYLSQPQDIYFVVISGLILYIHSACMKVKRVHQHSIVRTRW